MPRRVEKRARSTPRNRLAAKARSPAGQPGSRAVAQSDTAGGDSGFRIGHAVFQVPCVRRILVGLQRLRRRGRAQGREAHCHVYERDQSRSRCVQGEGWQADRVARVVGPGADGAREHQVLRAGPGARRRRARLLPHVLVAGCASLRWGRAPIRLTGRRRSLTGSRTARHPTGDGPEGRGGGAVSRTRPLCPYPQRADYKGSGSTDDAANFVCR